jgi:hypothetical protein
MGLFDSTTLLSVAGVAAILAVVLQFAKMGLGEDKKWLPIISVIAGMVLVDITYAVTSQLGLSALGFWNASLTGFLGGALACGFYELPSAAGKVIAGR